MRKIISVAFMVFGLYEILKFVFSPAIAELLAIVAVAIFAYRRWGNSKRFKAARKLYTKARNYILAEDEDDEEPAKVAPVKKTAPAQPARQSTSTADESTEPANSDTAARTPGKLSPFTGTIKITTHRIN
ncbi:MAG: hypothetical protein ACQR33_03065 [Candidatus Saccharibacteria bacterium]